MKMAVESMAMTPGAIPRPGRVPEQSLLSPETCFGDGGRDGTFRGRRLVYLGFLCRELYIGGRARSVEAWWPQTTPRRDLGLARA